MTNSPDDSMPACKILSLDGGGSWAILQAMALANLYGAATPGHDLLKRFDFAVANSGGSIVLGGLVAGYSPQALIDLFNSQSHRQTIFVSKWPVRMPVERYRTPAKLAGLKKILAAGPHGNLASRPLDQIEPPCRLVFCAFNYDRMREDFFRSDPGAPAATAPGQPQPTLAEAVHASSNAPIKYFDAPAEFESPAFRGARYWDGALGGFNNPVLAAVTEALTYNKWQPHQLRVLSLGTGSTCLPMPPDPIPAPDSLFQDPFCVPITSSGLIGDIKNRIASVILDDPPDHATYIAHLMVSGYGSLSQNFNSPVQNGNLVRLNPSLQPLKGTGGKWTAPKLRQFAPESIKYDYPRDEDLFTALVGLDLDAIEQAQVDLITTLGRAWLVDVVPNQSIRVDGQLRTLIGHDTFEKGRTQAESLDLVPPRT